MRLWALLLQESGIFLRNWSNIVISLLYTVSCIGYFLVPHSAQPFFGLLALMTIQFGSFLLLAAYVRGGYGPSLTVIFVLAAVLRFALWFSDPILENDFWRYLWDGRVLAHGINPYLYPPQDHALDSISTVYRGLIGWPQYGTIYPPLAEILFGLTHLVAGDSVLGLKVMLTAFDLGTAVILVRWLRGLGRDPRWVFLYLLNPLVLKEIGNSAHLDSIAMFFCFAAIYMISAASPRRGKTAWAMLALGAGAKLYPIVLLPLFIRVDRFWKRGLMIFVAVLTGLYLPFVSAGARLFGGTGAYAKYWIFNASVFKLASLGLGRIFGKLLAFFPKESTPFFTEAIKNDYLTKGLLGIVFIVSAFWRARKLRNPEELAGASLWVLGLLLVLSPVVNGWYVLWLLPLASLLCSVPWLAFSYLVVGSYSWFYSKELAPYFRMIEYGAFFVLLYLSAPSKEEAASFNVQS